MAGGTAGVLLAILASTAPLYAAAPPAQAGAHPDAGDQLTAEDKAALLRAVFEALFPEQDGPARKVFIRTDDLDPQWVPVIRGYEFVPASGEEGERLEAGVRVKEQARRAISGRGLRYRFRPTGEGWAVTGAASSST